MIEIGMTPSREAAQECSPGRKPGVKTRRNDKALKGRKKQTPMRKW